MGVIIGQYKLGEVRDFTRIKFLNKNIGFVCGGYSTGARLYKTTNGGINWFLLNIPGGDQIIFDDMSVLNEDTIWVVAHESLVGGVFRTTNGGLSWTQQFAAGSLNPSKIYMFNSRIGYIGLNAGTRYISKTTDGGFNWTTIVNNDYFEDMYFADSLLGWKCSAFGMKKTTNGGLNWVTQQLPSGGNILNSGVSTFSNINSDTIWAAGSNVLFPNNQFRGILLRTTNGGNNWLYQIPDTSIHHGGYWWVNFVNKLNGWGDAAIHTVTGGDTTFYTGIQHISSEIPKLFELKQNYPNPFNPRTVILYSLKKSGYVKLIAYDITGKEIQRMVDGYQWAGDYNVDFMGKFTPSGIYFYRMQVTDEKTNQLFSETKKMFLIK